LHPSEKYESHLGLLFHILWKNKNVPNQPVIIQPDYHPLFHPFFFPFQPTIVASIPI
jgi:hypothetical protein